VGAPGQAARAVERHEDGDEHGGRRGGEVHSADGDHHQGGGRADQREDAARAIAHVPAREPDAGEVGGGGAAEEQPDRAGGQAVSLGEQRAEVEQRAVPGREAERLGERPRADLPPAPRRRRALRRGRLVGRPATARDERERDDGGRARDGEEREPPVVERDEADERHPHDPRGGLADDRPGEHAGPPGGRRPGGDRGDAAREDRRHAEAERGHRGEQEREPGREGRGDAAQRQEREAAQEQAAHPQARARGGDRDRARRARHAGDGAELPGGGEGHVEVPRQLGEHRRERHERGLGREHAREQDGRGTHRVTAGPSRPRARRGR
jgi:hypothetical protein